MICLGGSKPLLGDTLVIIGTVFFGMSNVGEVIGRSILFLAIPCFTIFSLRHKVILKTSLLTLQEFCVKKKDRVEVVCMIGVFGFLVTMCEMYPLIT